MNPHSSNARSGHPLGAALLATLLAALAAGPISAQPLEATTPVIPNTRARSPVTLNFVNADIEAVSRAIGTMLDRQIVVDPRVKGTITVTSDKPQPPLEAYRSYLAALRGLGFTVVDSAGLLKVVPEAEAKLQTGTVSIGQPTVRGDQVLTQIFKLNHENPNNLVAILRPLISANNTINANPASSTLIITDYADNLQRLSKIIAALDQPTAADVEVIQVKHALAADLAPLVQRLAEGGTGAAVPGVPQGQGSATSIAVDARSNSLIVRTSNPARMLAVRALIAKLDQPVPNGGGPAGNIWVVYLKNADATRMAEVLRAAMAGGSSLSGASGGAGGGLSGLGGGLGGGAGGGGGGNQPAPGIAPGGVGAGGITGGASPQATSPVQTAGRPVTGGMIQADPASNSLIITAPEAVYRQMRQVIDQLDARRAQVYIESMIVEVVGDNAADFGFQWLGLLGKEGDKYGLVGGTNFTNSSTPSIIDINTGAAAGTVTLGTGLNIGLLRNFGGTYALAAIARAMQQQTTTNIISTPNLITLDNEEAKIVVGTNVPFITGQYTNSGSAVTSPFQTIERKDVGITLRIRPQIGENGAVRMTIYQEASSLQPTTAAGTNNAGPSTNKRSIESTVVVDDGAILVLGGLIEDRYTSEQFKVPLLGDIPYLGALFKLESRSKSRTNMMVFLRPIVLRDAESSNRLSVDRYEMIRGVQAVGQPVPTPVLPISESPVLPELRRADDVTIPLSGPPTSPGNELVRPRRSDWVPPPTTPPTQPPEPAPQP